MVVLEEQGEREKYSVFLEDLTGKLRFSRGWDERRLRVRVWSWRLHGRCNWHIAMVWSSRLRKLGIQLRELPTWLIAAPKIALQSKN